MDTFFKVVGTAWALIGVTAGLMQWTTDLMYNLGVYVLPGLIVCGVGMHLGRRTHIRSGRNDH